MTHILVLFSCTSSQSDAPIRVGIQASPGQAYVDLHWKPIFDEVAERLGTTANVTAIATDDDAYAAVKNSALDYFYVGGALYNCLQAQYGVASIASSFQIVNGVSTSVIGPQIIARKDSNITTIQQIRGRRVAIPQLGYLSAGQAQWFQLSLDGINLFQDTNVVIITQTQTSTILAIYTGVVDVGFITSGQLELAAASGFFSVSDFVTVNRINSTFPGNVSTIPPPGSVLVALSHVDLVSRTQVASILFDMNTSLSLGANISDWVSPQNYLPVLVLQQNLHLYSLPSNGSSPYCIHSANAQDYVTCPPGFIKDDKVICKLNNNTCPSEYTCLCNPCRPPPHSKSQRALKFGLIIPFVVLFSIGLLCLCFTFRFLRLRVHTISWKNITLLDVIGANSYGLVRKGMMDDDVIVLKRVQSELHGVEELDLPRSNRRAKRSRQLSSLYNQLPVMTKRRKRAMQILTNAIQHENLCPVIGITYGPSNTDLIMVTPLMKNGSIYDLLLNSTVYIDDSMRIAMLKDIVSGIKALHQRGIYGRDIRSHHLLLDDSFNVKLSSVNSVVSSSHIEDERRIWLSPENANGKHHTASSDMYALGMLIYEMFYRKPPYDGISLSEILASWKPPSMDSSRMNDDLHALMQACWANEPSQRPSLGTIQQYIEKQTTISLAEAVFMDPKRARGLLKQILPLDDAQCLKEGNRVPPRVYHDVSIAVITPVDIDRIFGKSKAVQVSQSLSDKFNQMCSRLGLMPLTTIDHRYLAVGNLIAAQPDHATLIAQFCLDAIEGTNNIAVSIDVNSTIDLNIGIHTGDISTQVMGSIRPCFTVRGKSMTIAQKMSDTTQAGVIQLSKSTFHKIKYHEKFKNSLAQRMGWCHVRGIGAVESYWLYTINNSSLRHRHLLRNMVTSTPENSTSKTFQML